MIYKIMDTTTGLYSTGSGAPRFTKRGKSWARMSDVRSHIRIIIPSAKEKYKQCVLVEYKEVVNRTFIMVEILEELKEK